MQLRKSASLVLAAVLQVAPICRVALVTEGWATTGFAIVLRWAVVAGVAWDTCDAASAPSAYVAGLQNLNPPGPISLTAAGAVGQSFLYRIYVVSAGQNPEVGYFSVTGLPPGLTINTNIGANGGSSNIVGTPTIAGVYPVTLFAGNLNYTNPSGNTVTVSTNATITISGGTGGGPQITNGPVGLTNVAGGTATFSVGASGTAPLSYQWRLNVTSNLPGATTNTLTLTKIRTNQTGNYTVVVTNSSGSVTSSIARLLVTVPPAPILTSSPPSGNQLRFSFVPVVGLTNTVLTNGVASNSGWVVFTNIPPPVSASTITVTDSFSGATKFYRVKFDP
jgi:hypothetical protein